jgi:hypothetical protein
MAINLVSYKIAYAYAFLTQITNSTFVSKDLSNKEASQ